MQRLLDEIFLLKSMIKVRIMRILFAFDVDGTLDISNGPISSKWLYKLKEKGAIVGFAGNHDKAKKEGLLGFDFYDTGDPEALERIKKKFKADLYIHIGDTEEDKESARKAGFTFIRAEDFRIEE